MLANIGGHPPVGDSEESSEHHGRERNRYFAGSNISKFGAPLLLISIPTMVLECPWCWGTTFSLSLSGVSVTNLQNQRHSPCNDYRRSAAQSLIHTPTTRKWREEVLRNPVDHCCRVGLGFRKVDQLTSGRKGYERVIEGCGILTRSLDT